MDGHDQHPVEGVAGAGRNGEGCRYAVGGAACHRSRRRALPGGGEAYRWDLGEVRGQEVGEARRMDGRWKGRRVGGS